MLEQKAWASCELIQTNERTGRKTKAPLASGFNRLYKNILVSLWEYHIPEEDTYFIEQMESMMDCKLIDPHTGQTAWVLNGNFDSFQRKYIKLGIELLGMPGYEEDALVDEALSYCQKNILDGVNPHPGPEINDAYANLYPIFKRYINGF